MVYKNKGKGETYMEKKKVAKKVLKIIGIILLIIFAIFVINTIRKLAIIKSIQRTASQYTASTNYHVKSVGSGMNDGITTTINSYCKGNKRLTVIERSKDGKVDSKVSMYDNGERVDTFSESDGVKRVNIDSEANFSLPVYDYFEGSSNMQLICIAIASKVEDIEYNGKKCYRVAIGLTSSILYEDNNEINEVYIDKDTGLVVKTHFGNSTAEREYEFNNVQDEVFVEPDLKEYEVIKK